MAQPSSRTPASIATARELMERFAVRTGLQGGGAPRRYLWTDAFAACNALALWEATGDGRALRFAYALVDQVHEVLGRHRPGDLRAGWISGLGESEGRAHPTRGGLRIGKRLPERSRDEPLDERLEWDRDGQYFHYLTKWMHALDQLSRRTGEARFNSWARELAVAAFDGFVSRRADGRLGMVWKMSIDLTRPLVPSMGQHDPIDGLVSCLQLRATAADLGELSSALALEQEISAYLELAKAQPLATTDPLGIGGLLCDAVRVAQLVEQGLSGIQELPQALLQAALSGLRANPRDMFTEPAGQRLAFRELGLAIGLLGCDWLVRRPPEGDSDRNGRTPLAGDFEDALEHMELARSICDFWLRGESRQTRSWLEHEDINDVMLATCLVPQGFVFLPSPSRDLRPSVPST